VSKQHLPIGGQMPIPSIRCHSRKGRRRLPAMWKIERF